MSVAADNYLHTTHRTVNWFRKTFEEGELMLTPPYQRQAVWTNLQKSYLIDTILNGLPIPELYMQDIGNEEGKEEHVIVDGQQRIRAVLDYLTGQFAMDGPDVSAAWRDRHFEDLTIDQKKSIYNYKFVVRVLPSELIDADIRAIFSRINKNVVNLNDQELRNATYSGQFISAIQLIADGDEFWSNAGIFTANDHRRMLDHEFISELAISYLHGIQNKKDKIDFYYRQYEELFEQSTDLIGAFKETTMQIRSLLPNLAATRWKKRSDFYTLFNELIDRREAFPLTKDDVQLIGSRIVAFGDEVDAVLRVDDESMGNADRNVLGYARSVSRAASDRSNRIIRSYAFSRYVFHEEPRHKLPEPRVELDGQIVDDTA